MNNSTTTEVPNEVPDEASIIMNHFKLNSPINIVLTVGGILHILLSLWTVFEYFVVNKSNFVLPVSLYEAQVYLQSLQQFRIFKCMSR